MSLLAMKLIAKTLGKVHSMGNLNQELKRGREDSIARYLLPYRRMINALSTKAEFNGVETSIETRDNVLSLARLECVYSFKHQLGVFRSSFIYPVAFSTSLRDAVQFNTVQSLVFLRYF